MPREMLARLAERGLEPIKVYADPLLEAPIASHADMNVLVVGDRCFSLQETFVRKERGETPIDRGTTLCRYPLDAALNAVCVGNDIICREQSVYPEALKHARRCGMNVISVKQGYVKCNLLVVDELKKAVITEDVGIERMLIAHGYNVLRLRTHGVELKPYANGFIGGASGVNERAVLFCGNVAMHEEFENIRAFCHRYGKEVVSLGDEKLYDYGSIVALP